MPPFGFRKRERERSSSPPRAVMSLGKKTTPKGKKPTLFEAVDEPVARGKSVADNKKFLEQLNDDDDDEESLSETDSEEFEDVPAAKRRKTAHKHEEEAEADDGDDDDTMEWEDAIPDKGPAHASSSNARPEAEIEDISVSMNDDGTYIEPLVSAATGKKGPSKRERQVRTQAHCLHVQTLMAHNTIRNAWLNDPEVQKTLVDELPEGVKREIRHWKEAMRRLGHEIEVPSANTPTKSKGKQGKRGGKKNAGRDWNNGAEHSKDIVHGPEPLLRLLKVLTAYWRKRFNVTAPGIRKQGYKSLRRLRDEVRAWEKNQKDFEEYGERVETLADFQKLAKKCEGSRDVGGQLFVALLRGIGLHTRMVANLQPIGFGFSKAEDADPKRDRKKQEKAVELSSESEDDKPLKKKNVSKTEKKATKASGASQTNGRPEKPTRKSARGIKTDPINLEDSDSPLSSPPSEAAVDDAVEDDDDDLSIIDITPAVPKRKIGKKYDRDMAFPTYWTEACSPLSHKYYPVDPIVLSTIASNDELLQTFEPRGKKAERAKQVICYTIAFSSDGTAKDVTVRYLKRHQLPGKTKGMRMGVEKVPIYNRKGKVKRYEDYDWFKTVMLCYERQQSQRTAADDLEEQTDLLPFKPSKEKKEVVKESLQGYKQSADFVLEQHLRREEALLPGSEPVKYFTSGKGGKEEELAVYSRDDVVNCKTVESWHKEGRAIKLGVQPLKHVPVRAVTLVRKREMEDAQRETGEKLKQGLYSEDQTDWIIPPPIENGVIPKNAFGNMDVYVPTMVPKGAVHLPLKGTAKLCRKLNIDYAEACTGFEFGKQRAVPVLTGVVVAQENGPMVRDAWRADQAEIRRKEDVKRTATSLHWWRKMLLGLRVLERMRKEYADSGGTGEDVNPFIRKAKAEGRASYAVEQEPELDNEAAGGFFRPGHEEEEVPNHRHDRKASEQQDAGGFAIDENEEDNTGGGGFLVEDDLPDAMEVPTNDHAPVTPVSLQSMHKTPDESGDSEHEATTGKAQPPKSRSSKKPNNTARPSSKPVAKTNRSKARALSPTSGASEASDSPLSTPGSLDSDQESESTVATRTPALSSRQNTTTRSPQVVVRNGNGLRTNVAKKSTPIKSQYFAHSEDDDEEMSDEESEEEVIKPRKTTSRTRVN